MNQTQLQIGDIVLITTGEWAGAGGIVSWPISADEPGYVLVHSEGRIAGVRLSAADLSLADKPPSGFTQLTYQLNRLSSLLIEKSFL